MEDIAKRVSRTLKALRQERGWSLDRTAQETGVSKAMLGQIERGESSPTIATLWKIATGFQTAFSAFIEEGKSGQMQQLHPADEKIRVLNLFPFDPALHFEVFIIELFPGCEHHSPAHKAGVVEHIIVTQGTMEVLADGQWHTINTSEGFTFNAHQAHGYRNRTSEVVRFNNIIHYPT